MGWGIFTYIFGVIAIVGPLVVAYWYGRAARRKFREFVAAAEKGGASGDQAGPAA